MNARIKAISVINLLIIEIFYRCSTGVRNPLSLCVLFLNTQVCTAHWSCLENFKRQETSNGQSHHQKMTTVSIRFLIYKTPTNLTYINRTRSYYKPLDNSNIIERIRKTDSKLNFQKQIPKATTEMAWCRHYLFSVIIKCQEPKVTVTTTVSNANVTLASRI